MPDDIRTVLERAAVCPEDGPDIDAIAARGRQLHRSRLVSRASVILLAGAVAAFGLRMVTSAPHTDRVVAASAGSTFTDAEHGLAVTIPPGWSRSPTSLTARFMSDPVEILALATVPISDDGRGPACDAQLPLSAVDRLGPGDALIWVTQSAMMNEQAPPRPAHFGPADGNAVDCPLPSRTVRSVSFADGGRRIGAGLVFGASVSAARRAEAWGILGSLRFDPVIEPAAGTSVIVGSGQDPTANVVDFRTQASPIVALPHKRPGDYPNDLLAVAGYLVYPGENGTWALKAPYDSPPRFLGVSTYDVASTTPDRVWLVTTNDAGKPTSTTAREVSVDGSYAGPTYTLPEGTGPVTGTTVGLLVRRGDRYVIWDPSTGKYGTELSGASVSDLIDVHGDLVALASSCSNTNPATCAAVTVTDVRSGIARDYLAPKDSHGWIPTGGLRSRAAFSSDNESLAMRAQIDYQGSTTSEVVVVDLPSGHMSVVADSLQPFSSPVAWVAGVKWLAYADTHGDLWVYYSQTAQRRPLYLHCCPGGLVSGGKPE